MTRGSTVEYLLRLIVAGQCLVIVLLGGNILLHRTAGVGVENVMAAVSQSVLTGLGMPVTRRDAYLQTQSMSVEIVTECTGLTVIALLGAFVLAFPASWRARLWGLGLAAVLIWVANVARIVLLMSLVSRPHLMEPLHHVGWPLFIVASSVVYFQWWSARVKKPA